MKTAPRETPRHDFQRERLEHFPSLCFLLLPASRRKKTFCAETGKRTKTQARERKTRKIGKKWSKHCFGDKNRVLPAKTGKKTVFRPKSRKICSYAQKSRAEAGQKPGKAGQKPGKAGHRPKPPNPVKKLGFPYFVCTVPKNPRIYGMSCRGVRGHRRTTAPRDLQKQKGAVTASSARNKKKKLSFTLADFCQIP